MSLLLFFNIRITDVILEFNLSRVLMANLNRAFYIY